MYRYIWLLGIIKTDRVPWVDWHLAPPWGDWAVALSPLGPSGGWGGGY